MKKIAHGTKEVKGVAAAMHREGATYSEIGESLAVSASTAERWAKSSTINVNPKQLEEIKKAIDIADHQFITQSAYIQALITNTIINKINNNELERMSLTELFRAGIEEAKRYGIRTDKVLMRSGGVIPGAPPPSVAALLALALSKAEMDRQATARIEAETAAYKASYEEKVVN